MTLTAHNFEKSTGMFVQAVENRLFSAGALAIGCRDRVFVKKAAGYVSYNEGASAVRTDTLFDMASLSKILGPTMCALKLIDGGTVSPDDRITSFLPGVPDDKAHITIRDLMTHTSGLPAEIFLYRECKSPDDAVSVILNRPLHYPTGTKTVYSCMGYILLGKILERITGKRLDRLSQDLVFTPLGMSSTGYRPTELNLPADNIAYTEVKTLWGCGMCGAVHDENARFLGGVSGNAGIFSDLDDMISFARALSVNHAGLSDGLFESAVSNYTRGFDDNRGLGFQLGGPELTFMGHKFGESCYGHTGYTGTSMLIDKESGVYVILLTNRVHPTRNTPLFFEFRRNLHDTVYDDLFS